MKDLPKRLDAALRELDKRVEGEKYNRRAMSMFDLERLGYVVRVEARGYIVDWRMLQPGSDYLKEAPEPRDV